MKTLIIYESKDRSVKRILTPHNQGSQYSDKERFDENWHRLIEHFGDNHGTEIV